MTVGLPVMDPSLLRQDAAPTSAKEIGQQVEQLFARMMLSQMTQPMMGGEGLFSGSAKQYGDMMVDLVSQQVAEGGGLGLADQLMKRLQADGLSGEQALADLPAAGRRSLVQAMRAYEGASGHEAFGGKPHPASVPAAVERAILPVKGARISSDFGHRVDPMGGGQRGHHGIDLAAPKGTPIRSVRAGVVVSAGPRGSYGNLVEVRHADGSTARYAHCDRVDVVVGQRLKAGETLATVGSTGRSTGPHVHLELHVDGKPVDPAKHLGWE